MSLFRSQDDDRLTVLRSVTGFCVLEDEDNDSVQVAFTVRLAMFRGYDKESRSGINDAFSMAINGWRPYPFQANVSDILVSRGATICRRRPIALNVGYRNLSREDHVVFGHWILRDGVITQCLSNMHARYSRFIGVNVIIMNSGHVFNTFTCRLGILSPEKGCRLLFVHTILSVGYRHMVRGDTSHFRYFLGVTMVSYPITYSSRHVFTLLLLQVGYHLSCAGGRG